MTFEKSITPNYETIGRRRKLTGHIGQITDESGLVLHSHIYDSRDAAKTDLDRIVYELLVDYAERGLVDMLPEAQQLAAHAAHLTGRRWHVVADGHGTIADDADVACYGYKTIATAEPNALPTYAIPDFPESILEPIPAFVPAELPAPFCVTCACGAPAVLWVHGKDIHDDVCHACFTRFYDENEEDSRSWVADPIAPPEPSLLADVHAVLIRCLDGDRLVAIVPELRRVLERVEQALCVEQLMTA